MCPGGRENFCFAQSSSICWLAIFLASLVAMFSGAQMFALGIIGEYLARVHLRSMERQPYTVRKSIGPGRPGDKDDAGAEREGQLAER